jgi:hypothetical protein
VLDRYPVVPAAHHRLSKSDPDETDQRLLNDALAEQRRENKKQLQALLKSRRRFHRMKTGCRMKLSTGEIEWLLQVLNDVRVGSWITLGSPEYDWHMVLDDKSAPHVWALELSGYFQSRLLEALRHPVEPVKAKRKRRRKGKGKGDL